MADNWLLLGNNGTDPSKNFLGTTDNQPLVVKTKGVEVMRVATTGNVGIGTDKPSARLHVTKSFRFGGDDGYFLVGTDPKPGPYPTPIKLKPGWTGITFFSPGFYFRYHGMREIMAVHAGNDTDSIEFNATLSVEGNVGIGKTNPKQKLDVNGWVKVGGENHDWLMLTTVQNVPVGQNRGCLHFDTDYLSFWHDGPGDILTIRKEGYVSVGNTTIVSNGIVCSSSKYNAIGLNGDESSLNFAHPDDGHYTIMVDGRNNKLSVGSVLIDGNAGDVILQNADCAEDFRVVEQVESGTVMTLNDAGQLEPGAKPYDKRVVGVVSGAGEFKPALILGRDVGSTDRVPIALMGRVYCKVDASYAPIEVGDLLTTSATLGHAMKASDSERAFGAVLGKALSPLLKGGGMIPILIALQ
jgi:hypothetical protein